MRKFYCCSVLILLFIAPAIAQTNPIIHSVSPLSGPIGTMVTINGSGFNPTPASNIVYFGAVRGNVEGAAADRISVRIGAGITNDLISVTNTATGLTAFFDKPFSVSFTGSAVTASSFTPRVDFSAGPYPFNTASGD